MIFYFIALPLCSLQSLIRSSLLIFYLFLSQFLFTHSSPSLFFASLAQWQEPLSSAKHKLKVLLSLSSISPSFSPVSVPASSLSILLLPLSIYLAIGQRWCHHLPLAPVNNLLEGSVFTVSWGVRKCSHIHENTHSGRDVEADKSLWLQRCVCVFSFGKSDECFFIRVLSPSV